MHIEALVIFINVLHLRATQDGLVGCFQDYNDDREVLQGKYNDLDPNGSDECKEFCEGYRFYGTESGDECFCGNEMKSNEKTDPCTEECKGNPGEYCGGHWKIIIYDNWHCALEPCKNGAICVDINAEKYDCYCTEGWEGDNCEESKKEYIKSQELTSSKSTLSTKRSSKTTNLMATSTNTDFIKTILTTKQQSVTDTGRNSTGSRPDAVIAVAVTVPLLVIGLLAITIFIVYRKRKRLCMIDMKTEKHDVSLQIQTQSDTYCGLIRNSSTGDRQDTDYAFLSVETPANIKEAVYYNV